MSRTIHLRNGIIVTNPLNGSTCHSLTIQDGFVVRQNESAPREAIQIDLAGNFALPGLVDSHLHLTLAAKGLDDVDLSDCRNRQDFNDSILDASKEMQKNEWIVASGWTDNHFDEYPSVEWFPKELEVPCICFRSDYHTAILNFAALNELDTRQILKITGGEAILQGIVGEDALFQEVIPYIPEQTTSSIFQKTEEAVQILLQNGITLVGSMEHKCDVDAILYNLQSTKTMRVRAICFDEPTIEMIDAFNSFKSSDFLDLIGFKSFLDGTLGSRTAKMYHEWNDVQGSGEWTGHASDHELVDWVQVVAQSGYAPFLHAIGDEAVGTALDLLSQLDPSLCARIEHAQCIADRDLEKLKDGFFGVQPLHLIDDIKVASKALGKVRASQMHNWRRMLDARAHLSFGSDWPIAPPNAIKAIQVAVTNGVTVEEAIIASTIESARSLQTPLSGHLECGAYGDVVVLDKDPYSIDWNVERPVVLKTLVGGDELYTKE